MSMDSIDNPLGKYKGDGIGNYEAKYDLEKGSDVGMVLSFFEELFKSSALSLNLEKTLDIVPALPPEQLQWVSENLTKVYQHLLEVDESEFKYRASHLLQSLVAKSFSRGHNNFTLKPQIHLSMFSGFQLKNKLFLDYHGNLYGDSFGNTKNVHATIYGNIEVLSANDLNNCTLIFNGDVGTECAHSSKNSVIYFKGLEHGLLENFGKIGEKASHCAFITSDVKDYENFKNTRTNVILLIENKKEVKRKGRGKFMNKELENLVNLEKIL